MIWGRYAATGRAVACRWYHAGGCVSDQVGTDFASVSRKVGPPRAGHSRIVFLQDKRSGLSMAFCACEVKLDGAPLGKVLAGKYAYADRPAGRHDVLVTELMFPGDSKREVMMESGRTHFYLIKSSARHDAATGGRYSAAWPGLRSFPSRRPARRIPVRRSSSHSTKRPRERSSPSCRPSSRMRIIAATRPWSRAG